MPKIGSLLREPHKVRSLSSAKRLVSSSTPGMSAWRLYDPARKKLIWRGDASKTVDLKKDPKKVSPLLLLVEWDPAGCVGGRVHLA
jgi:hypothetical protein